MKQYYTGSYPTNHRAMQPFTFDQPRVIAIATWRNLDYAFYFDQDDKRMFRGIVRFINNDDMQSTFNRDYTDEETEGRGS